MTLNATITISHTSEENQKILKHNQRENTNLPNISKSSPTPLKCSVSYTNLKQHQCCYIINKILLHSQENRYGERRQEEQVWRDKTREIGMVCMVMIDSSANKSRTQAYL